MSPTTESLIATLDSIDLDNLGPDKYARPRIVEAARRLLNRLESPFERMWRQSVSDPCVDAACKTLHDLGVWENWKRSGADEVPLQRLIDFCKVPCDLVLLRRLMRLLTAERYVDETGEDTYRATALSLALGDTTGPVCQTWRSGWSYETSPIRNLPSFLSKTDYREPDDPMHTNHMDADSEGLGFFARCAKSPKVQAGFMGAMTGLATSKPDWTEIYDTRLLLDGWEGRDSDDSNVLLVDIATVGGAHGVDLTRVLAKYPDLPSGSLVLHDLADIVQLGKPPAEVKAAVRELHEPQIVVGARAYFLHACLHDWDDIDSRRILKQVARVTKAGYSKLLLYEVVMPSTGASTYQAMSDIGMMYELSAAERNEARWCTLLLSAGFNVVTIWSSPFSLESVIEAELC